LRNISRKGTNDDREHGEADGQRGSRALKPRKSASLRPVPPGESKQKEVRYLDIQENDQLDEVQLAAWVKQASQLPGERM
jgi:hypothetical protein